MMVKWKLGNTLWWSNTKGRWRQDTLVGFTRSYNRDQKAYLYRFTLGRFTIGVML